jgi:tyrosine-protein kinase Etk/Wzc
MIPTETQNEHLTNLGGEDAAPAESETSLLDTLILLAEHKRFIGRFVLGGLVLATIVAFVLPVRYEGNAVLMPPQQNSSIGSSLLGQLGNMGGLGPLAALATGSLGIKNQTDMYVSLLTSRTVEDAIIQRFDLMKEYGKKRMSDTRKKLESRTSVVGGVKDGLIRITVEDGDPRRAAEMANGYVDEFRKLSATLAITEAQRRRLFFEQQLEQSKEDLNKAEDAMRKTQQSTGVLQIDSQARALIESAAILRAQVMAKEVQIQSMRSFAAEDNPRLVLAKQELAALQTQLDRVAGSQNDSGSDINLSKGRVTAAGMEYVDRYRDLKYREAVFELLAKEFEVAKLDEAREGAIIQVVDTAVPADKRSFPPRIVIVLLVTFIAFALSVLWVIAAERWGALPDRHRRVQTLRALLFSKH